MLSKLSIRAGTSGTPAIFSLILEFVLIGSYALGRTVCTEKRVTIERACSLETIQSTPLLVLMANKWISCSVDVASMRHSA